MIGKKQNYESVKKDALVQTSEYAKICGVNQADILIFDRDGHQGWSNDEENESIEYQEVKLEIWKLAQSEKD